MFEYDRDKHRFLAVFLGDSQSMVQYEAQSKTLTIRCNSLTIESNLYIKGDINAKGHIKAEGHIIDTQGNTNHHTH